MLLLLLARVAAAGPALIVFDYPPEWQPRVQFWAHLSTVSQGRAVAQDVPLLLVSCDGQPGLTPEAQTVCAALCFAPGDTTVRVYATQLNQRSGDSNLADITEPAERPCQAPLPFPSPQPQPPSTQPPIPIPPPPIPLPPLPPETEPTQPNPSLLSLVNFGCVSWKIEGVCACGFPPHPCVKVSYWEPAYLVETVKRPGSSTIALLQPVLDAALAAGALPLQGGGGAGNASGTGMTNLHFSDAHVYPFPQVFGGPCTSCAPSVVPALVHYASELDPFWRVGKGNPLASLIRIGVWAALFPRIGHVIHGSPSVASGAEAVRALDIAHVPVTPLPNPEAHIVLEPAPAAAPAATCCMQLAQPVQTPCLTAGTPPALWDHGIISIRGMYLWTIWKYRSCCTEASQTTCGITLPGIGGAGQNTCVPVPEP